MPTTYAIVKAWRAKNKDKVNAQARRRRAKKPEHVKAQQLAWRMKNIERLKPIEAERARRYRKDPEGNLRRSRKYKAKLRAKREAQAGRPMPEVCEVCGECNLRVVYDHCHATGQFRGWLCDRCNKVLGIVKDDAQLMRKLATYLENPHGETYDQGEESAAHFGVCWPG